MVILFATVMMLWTDCIYGSCFIDKTRCTACTPHKCIFIDLSFVYLHKQSAAVDIVTHSAPAIQQRTFEITSLCVPRKHADDVTIWEMKWWSSACRIASEFLKSLKEMFSGHEW